MGKNEASLVFSKISFQDDIDYEIYPISVYVCPVCLEKMSFSKKNFKKYALKNTSIFTDQEQNKIKLFLELISQAEPNSFIDFYYPRCKTPTRVYYQAWYGEHFTCGFELKFVIFDQK